MLAAAPNTATGIPNTSLHGLLATVAHPASGPHMVGLLASFDQARYAAESGSILPRRTWSGPAAHVAALLQGRWS